MIFGEGTTIHPREIKKEKSDQPPKNWLKLQFKVWDLLSPPTPHRPLEPLRGIAARTNQHTLDDPGQVDQILWLAHLV